MSRTLARLRAATGDPLLVRAGRAHGADAAGASELRERVRDLAQEARAVLRPAGAGWTSHALERIFTVRANDGLHRDVRGPSARGGDGSDAPGVRLRFAPKPDKDVRPLREGLVDLDVGVLGATGPGGAGAGAVPGPLRGAWSGTATRCWTAR